MRKQIITTYIMALLGFVLSSYMAYKFYDKETSNITFLFEKEIQNKVNTLNHEINNKIEILQSVRNLYLSSDFVTADEFDSFTKDILLQHPHIKALQWVPRILHKNRDKFEEQWQSKHPTFEITQVEKQGGMRRAYYKDEYYPIEYMAPFSGNEEVLGFDLTSDKSRNKILIASRDSGKIIATSSIKLVEGKNSHKAILFFLPIYNNLSMTVLKRRENIMGFVLGVFEIEAFVYDTIKYTDDNSVVIKIIDHTNANEIIYEYACSESQRLNQEHTLNKQLQFFASRQWSIEATPTMNYYKSRRTFVPYIIFIMGMTFVIIGSVYTLIIQRHSIHVEEGIQLKSEKLEQINKRLDLISKTDGLTQIANRRYFNEFYKREFRKAIRDKKKISLIMIDIDFFKNYNDSYGHLEGDNCLKEVAKTLNNLLHRAGDLVARYGGEEFVLVLPDTKNSVKIAHKCVKEIQDLQIPHESSTIMDVLTISAGVATLEVDNIDQMDELILLADEALYKAKELGRNQVVEAT